MGKTVRALVLSAWAIAGPITAFAAVTIDPLSGIAFTDHVDTGTVVSSNMRDGWFLMVGSIGVNSAVPSLTSATATHVPGDPSQDYALEFRGAVNDVYTRQYSVTTPYIGQSGQWLVTATDGATSASILTFTLDNARQLPFLQGLAATGNLLMPTLTWDRADPSLYGSFCPASCVAGDIIFDYRITVRRIDPVTGYARLFYESPQVYNTTATPSWTLPAGVLEANQQYAFGYQLYMYQFEDTAAYGVVGRTENRSISYLGYSTAAVPEPSTLAFTAFGLLGVLGAARRRRARARRG